MTREEAIRLFEKFSEVGNCGDCLRSYCETSKPRKCEPCYILFPKLRRFALNPKLRRFVLNDDMSEKLVNSACMCYFMPEGDFEDVVKKAWRYINGEWS